MNPLHPALCAVTLAAAALLLAAPAQAANGGDAAIVPVIIGTSGGGDPEVAGELLVKLRSTAALQPLLARQPLTLVSRFGARPIYRLKVVGTTSVANALARLALEPEVMIAEPHATHSSPEARRNVPWAIGNLSTYVGQWAPQAIRLGQARPFSLGAGVRVAVLDTGIDATHPLLQGRVLPGKDFVDGDANPAEVPSPTTGAWGHGTHVAGLVASVAPAARILPLRVLDTEGVGNAWVLAEAMLYAVDPDGNPATDDGAQVINLSLGSRSRTSIMATITQIAACVPAVPGDAVGDRSDPGYADDNTRCANSRGALVVAAAGNDASASLKAYPAAEGTYGMVSVAASNPLGRLAGFSNSGNWISLAAPGEGITSAMPGGNWATWSGTSMAAPLVAGTAALLRSANPSMTPKAVATRLKRTASTLCGTNLRQVDAYAALLNLEPDSGKCK